MKKKRGESVNGAGGGESAAEQDQAQSGLGGRSRRRSTSSTTGGGGGDGSDDKEPGSAEGYAKEQHRRAVRKDVADLVRGTLTPVLLASTLPWGRERRSRRRNPSSLRLCSPQPGREMRSHRNNADATLFFFIQIRLTCSRG